MAQTTQLTFTCKDPSCNQKRVNAIGDFNYNNTKYYILDCGHHYSVDLVISPIDKFDTYQSSKGDKPYKFQIEGMKFAEANNLRVLIADEMGLGKTVEGLGVLNFHPEVRPTLVVVKKKLTQQFFKEILRWNGEISQIVVQGHALLPGLQYYIISMDLLRAYPLERFKAIGIKSILIDEVQHIKNADSARTNFLRTFIKDMEINHIIALSGTPFKNRISEYFTILNILAPQYFNNREEFIRQHIEFYYDSSGKIREKGLKRPLLFKELIKNIVIRRERQDVEDQIPYIGIKRNIQYVDLDDKFTKAYESAEKEYLEVFENVGRQTEAMGRNSELLAILQRMRHIVGLSKIPDTVDFVTDFLMSTERKIIIFVHHQDVATMLINQLAKWCRMGAYPGPLYIKGSMPDKELDMVVTAFNTDPRYRILVASTLAAGEGLNLQHMCSEVILMERQWNAANEEQAERRVLRIGQKKTNVTATYMTAGGTIDEMLTEINERKRSLVKSGMLSANQLVWSESELFSQLGEMIGKKRNGVKWKLM